MMTSFRFAKSFKAAEGGGAASQVGNVTVIWNEGFDTSTQVSEQAGSWNASGDGSHVDGKKKVI